MDAPPPYSERGLRKKKGQNRQKLSQLRSGKRTPIEATPDSVLPNQIIRNLKNKLKWVERRQNRVEPPVEPAPVAIFERHQRNQNHPDEGYVSRRNSRG